MEKLRVPVEKPRPDIDHFIRVMRGELVPERPPMVEYLVDNSVMRPVLEDMIGRPWVDTGDYTEYMGGQMDFSGKGRETIEAWLDNQISFWYHMGYDFVRVEVSLPLPAVSHVVPDTANPAQHTRAWQGLTEGVIGSWEDFEKYPWPEVNDSCFIIHRYIADHLPEGLGFITCHAGGVYEHTSRLIGYQQLCYLLHDDPGLVKAVADRIGQLIFDYNRNLLDIPEISVIFQGEDFGFNTQTLIPPADIRRFFLPWHKKFAWQIHEKGRLYFIHSCGKIDAVMEDLIEDVRIDGKHSFQDNVLPIAQAKQLYGDRIALLGGVDVDKLTRLTPTDLRCYVRSVIEAGAPGGRFAVGAGNSIPSYIPVVNYLTMLDEALS